MAENISEELKLALDAAGDSAQRCRWTLLLLVTASVLSFMAMWNGFDSSWIRIRQTMLNKAVENWGATNTAAGFKASKDFVEEKWQMGSLYGVNTADGTNFLRHLEKRRDEVEELYNHEVRYVRIAFFGIGFDINDLGVFSGIAFSILLLILAFSLKREVRNLSFYFALASRGSRNPNSPPENPIEMIERMKIGYNLLAMRQVLTMPLVDQDSQVNLGWGFLQWVPLATPLFIQAAILVDDFFTFQVGQAWSPWRALALIGFDSAAVVFVGLFTTICASERNSIKREWAKAYKKAYPAA